MYFIDLANQCVPEHYSFSTLAAVIKTESGFNPLSIGINSKKIKLKEKPKTKAAAIAIAESLISKGVSVDLGLGQINSLNLPRLGLTVSDMFDACTNLQTSAGILKRNYVVALKSAKSEQHALQIAFSMYNTGSQTKGFKNGYVNRVFNNANVANLSSYDVQIPDVLPRKSSSSINSLQVQIASSSDTPLQIPTESTPKPDNTKKVSVMVFDGDVDKEPDISNKLMVY